MKFCLAMLVAAVGGFIALSYEILWYRAFSFVTWGQATTFGLLLGFYLAGIAVGSNRIRAFCRSSASDSRQLLVLARLLIGANVLGFLVVPTFSLLAPLNPMFGLGFVALSAAALGCVFPLACHYGIPSDAKTGTRLSYVYVANILGSASGSYLTGLVLMEHVSTRTLSALLLVAGVVLASLVLMAAKPRVGDLLTTAGAAVIALIIALPFGGVLFNGLYERMLYKKFGATPLAHVVENRHGVIVVSKDGHVFGGGAYDGVFSTSLTNDVNGVTRAVAVAAIHAAPHQVLMIGLASGSWAQIIASLPQVSELTIVEINPGYLQLIRQYPAVAGVLENPKVKIVIDDGRRWLLRNPGRTFDVVLMNTTWNWRASSTNLLSHEFMNLARRHLAPQGIFYFNTTSSWDAQRTAALTFPYALRVLNFMAASDSPIDFDAQRWETAITTTRSNGQLLLDSSSEQGRKSLQELRELARTYSSTKIIALEKRDAVLSRTAQCRLITDDNMRTEFLHPFVFPAGIADSSGS
jgi:spermidine synthase